MMIVALGVIFGLQYWRAQKNPALESPDHPAAVSTPAATPSSAATQASATAATSTPAVVAAAQTSTTVENTLYKITFSNQGGQVTSWILKKYKDNAGNPLDMVHQGAANLYGYPLSLYTYDDSLTKQLATALYVPSATGTLQAPATLTFKYSQGNLSVTKTFTFTDTYVIHADTQVLRDGPRSIPTPAARPSTSPSRRSPAAPPSTAPSTSPPSAINTSAPSSCPTSPTTPRSSPFSTKSTSPR
ncbi:MAG: membrane protein insertase YidC [Acidobacteriaceae bacterium]